MVCVGLQCSDMTSRGKFWGGRQNFGGAVAPPGTPLAPPLSEGNYDDFYLWDVKINLDYFCKLLIANGQQRCVY